MASVTEADTAALHEQMKQLRTDFIALTDTLQNLTRHGLGEAVERATAPGERAWGEIKSRMDAVSLEIRDKPITSALTAFGVGLVLGMVFGGRRA
jgi:ElaB/YqjD/DUF883 family membrane-anchored ribosome-binding protein